MAPDPSKGVYLNRVKTDDSPLFSEAAFLIQPTARARPHPPPVGVGGGVSAWCSASWPPFQVKAGVVVGVSAGVGGRKGGSSRSRPEGRLFQRRAAPPQLLSEGSGVLGARWISGSH